MPGLIWKNSLEAFTWRDDDRHATTNLYLARPGGGTRGWAPTWQHPTARAPVRCTLSSDNKHERPEPDLSELAGGTQPATVCQQVPARQTILPCTAPAPAPAGSTPQPRPHWSRLVPVTECGSAWWTCSQDVCSEYMDWVYGHIECVENVLEQMMQPLWIFEL